MRAIATNRFGGNDVLELTGLPGPIVGSDTVLVRGRYVFAHPNAEQLGRFASDGALMLRFRNRN